MLPTVSCMSFDEFANRFGGTLLKEVGDLQIENGDLAMTRDIDFRMGDIAYDAFRRLAEYWRPRMPHLQVMYELSALMIERERDVGDRLAAAEQIALRQNEGNGLMIQNPTFKAAWDAHWDEEATAQSGRDVFPASIMLLAASALKRFRDDLELKPKNDLWRFGGELNSGHSVGDIIIASANGVRHQDEWLKSSTLNDQQRASKDILDDVLVQNMVRNTEAYSTGRCEEILQILGNGDGLEGFTETIFNFAHSVARAVRSKSES